MARAEVLAAARGDRPADLVLRGGKVVNTFTGEVLPQDVAVADGVIVAVGESRRATEVVDVEGRFLCPGLIDAHVHLESSMVSPYQMARALVPRGTTCVVCDPHEIANVAGLAGIRWLLAASAGLPLDVLVNAPSCVPATHLATAGATLDHQDLASLLEEERVIGLAEVMNVPGVVLGDAGVLAKLDAFAGRPIDGHAPAVSGSWLNAYVAAGIGSDHECLSAGEAREKLRLGMRLFLREGTGAKNLLDLLPAVTPATGDRCAFCTDDRHPHDLLQEGHLDHLLRLAVANGLDPVTAIRMATRNAAEAFGLADRGAIAPGRRADLVVVSDLDDFHAEAVFCRGRCVARNGQPVEEGWPAVPRTDDTAVRGRMEVDPDRLDLRIPSAGSSAAGARVRVIGIVPGQIVTEHLTDTLPVWDGAVCADPQRDIVKLAVVERHRGSGNIGLGFVRGLGLRRGAIASTVAHDHHNLMLAGADDTSMKTAATEAVAMGGGLVAAAGEQVLARLPLAVAGLLSDQPIEQVRHALDLLLETTRHLGSDLPNPFMILSFLGLEVIPALKLTDQGLVDVERFTHVPLHVQ